MASAQTNRSSQPSFYLIAAPWDLQLDERGIESKELSVTLDQLRGEVALTGLSVWGAAPSSRRFRIREIEPRLIHAEGGLFFEPSQTRGGCRPPAVTTGSKSLVPAIANACARHDLALRLLLSTATMGGLAQYYPEFASRSAFDDPSRLSVCLLNPAVQECVAGVACGVPPQFGVNQIVFHDFRVGWFEAFDRSLGWPSSLGNVERTLLSTCFCPACVKAAQDAGVDANEVRKCVQNLVQKSLAQGTSYGGTEAGFLAEQTSLAAFKRVQADLLNSFLKRIVEDCRRDVLVARQPADSNSGVEQFDARVPAGVVTWAGEVTQLPNQIAPGARHSEVTLPAWTLLGSRAEEFIAAMSRLVEWGYAGVQIDDYGALPESAFTTLKQAIRFARRSARL
jgi:hypothetical protein